MDKLSIVCFVQASQVEPPARAAAEGPHHFGRPCIPCDLPPGSKFPGISALLEKLAWRESNDFLKTGTTGRSQGRPASPDRDKPQLYHH